MLKKMMLGIKDIVASWEGGESANTLLGFIMVPLNLVTAIDTMKWV